MEVLYLGGRLMTERLFKALNKDGSAFHGGAGTWHLPSDGTPGEWMPPIEGELVVCHNGYHLCRAEDLPKWLGPAIFEAEYRGECLEAEEKLVVREARLLRQLNWDDRTARLFACDCAEDAARGAAWAAGWEAAWAAGWAAARAAAGDVERAAEREWQSAKLMEYLYGSRK